MLRRSNPLEGLQGFPDEQRVDKLGRDGLSCAQSVENRLNQQRMTQYYGLDYLYIFQHHNRNFKKTQVITYQ